MARLPYLDKGASPAVDEAYAQVERLGRPVLNLYRMLANQPPALAAFLEMSRYVRDDSSLDPSLRELVILATAYELDQPYEMAHHTAAATRVGIPAAKIAAAGRTRSASDLSPAEACAVDFARQVAKNADMRRRAVSEARGPLLAAPDRRPRGDHRLVPPVRRHPQLVKVEREVPQK